MAGQRDGGRVRLDGAGVVAGVDGALGAIGDERGVPSLIEALKDSDANVRAQAAWALGAIGDGRAADALRAATRDKNENVRRQASWALSVL